MEELGEGIVCRLRAFRDDEQHFPYPALQVGKQGWPLTPKLLHYLSPVVSVERVVVSFTHIQQV